MRTFIAVGLSGEIRSKIKNLIEQLKNESENIKWVEEKNLHATLKFLGNVENIDEVIKSARQAVKGIEKFKMALTGAGNFGGRVLWVGIKQGKEDLGKIADRLNQLKPEERPFSGHITIGRARGKISKTLKKLKEHENSEFGEMMVEKINVMKSTLTRNGAIYEIIKEVML